MTNAERVGTSICDNNDLSSSKTRANSSVGASAARTRKMLAGMWVKTIVLSNPIRFATQGAANCEKAENSPDQKKNWPAAASDRSKRSNNHSASSEFTTRPPAKASTENSAASLSTVG